MAQYLKNTEIESMTEADWPAVKEIYKQGIATGNATFESDVPDWKSWNKDHLKPCRLVARQDGEVVGWAAIGPVSGRCVYAGVGEVSVYVAETARSGGVGKVLLLDLVKESEAAGIWTLEAGIFPENAASIRLHEACGFRQVGFRERLGQLAGVWRDVVLMERRSTNL